MSFFSAQNWFYPISERFGAFLAIFQIFHFFWNFSEFFGLKNGRKKFSRKMSFLVPIIGFTQFLNDLGHFSKFLKFGPFLAIFQIFHFFEIFSEFFGLKNRRKKFSRKMSFFSAQIGFTQFLNDLGHFWQFFKIFFIFLKFFPSFLVWKMGEKNHFLVPKIGFTQFLNDLGHFSKFLKFGPFLNFSNFSFFWKIFPSFLVWKTRRKKFSRKCHFLVPKIFLPNFWTIWGHFWQFFKFFIFLNFFRVFWSEKWAKKNFLEKCHF